MRQEANEDVRELRVREKLLSLGKVELSRPARQYFEWVKALGISEIFPKVQTLDFLHLKDPAPHHRVPVPGVIPGWECTSLTNSSVAYMCF